MSAQFCYKRHHRITRKPPTPSIIIHWEIDEFAHRALRFSITGCQNRSIAITLLVLTAYCDAFDWWLPPYRAVKIKQKPVLNNVFSVAERSDIAEIEANRLYEA